MDRWTMKELANISDIQFAIAILTERRNKITPYSPLAQKIKQAIRALHELEDKSST